MNCRALYKLTPAGNDPPLRACTLAPSSLKVATELGAAALAAATKAHAVQPPALASECLAALIAASASSSSTWTSPETLPPATRPVRLFGVSAAKRNVGAMFCEDVGGGYFGQLDLAERGTFVLDSGAQQQYQTANHYIKKKHTHIVTGKGLYTSKVHLYRSVALSRACFCGV